MGNYNLIEAIKGAFRYIVNLVRKVINGVLNFVKDVVKWFRRLNQKNKKDTPFVADADKFKELLKTAPKKKVGIFEGVYNEDEDEITAHQYVDADSVDQQTKSVLGNEPLVVLS